MRTYRIYASGIASANAVATLKIARGGKIMSVAWSILGQAGADATARGFLELSTQSVSNAQVNDAQGPISSCSYDGDVANGGFSSVKVDYPAFEVQDGQTLYINQYAAGTACASTNAYVEIRVA